MQGQRLGGGVFAADGRQLVDGAAGVGGHQQGQVALELGAVLQNGRAFGQVEPDGLADQRLRPDGTGRNGVQLGVALVGVGFGLLPSPSWRK